MSTDTGPIAPGRPASAGGSGGTAGLPAGGGPARPASPARRRIRMPGRFIAAAVVVVLVAAGLGLQHLLAPASYLLRIPTTDASGVLAGSDVTIAGVTAGTVRSVTVGQGGDAVVTIALDPAFAPVHRSATAQIRPKSLLGEMYVALNPGTSGPVLPSGATLPRLQVNRSTDLQQVINMFNRQTRAKLQTLVDELGGGLAGRGQQLNQAIPAGSHDVADLARITSTLNEKNAELQSVIATLDTVTTELSRSDRRQQLGVLIRSTNALMGNLRSQQAQLQRAVVQADLALGSLRQGLAGTAPALSGIAATLPQTVSAATRLIVPLATGSSTLMPQLSNLIRGIQYGPSVFGGRDANGYATRISLVLGCGSVSVCPPLAGQLGAASGLGGLAGTGATGQAPAGHQGTGRPAGSSGSGQGIFAFLLGGKP
jgi:virulence factor Mce-like protein